MIGLKKSPVEQRARNCDHICGACICTCMSVQQQHAHKIITNATLGLKRKQFVCHERRSDGSLAVRIHTWEVWSCTC